MMALHKACGIVLVFVDQVIKTRISLRPRNSSTGTSVPPTTTAAGDCERASAAMNSTS